MSRTILRSLRPALLGVLAALCLPGEPLTLGPQTHGQVVVLRSDHDGEMFPLPCSPGACTALALERGVCGRGAAQVVVVSGHSVPPYHYLHAPPDELARALTCLQPRLIVLDTCYGFSAPLLAALAEAGVTAEVVGPLRKLPPGGLQYDAAFYDDTAAPAARAAAVRVRDGEPLQRWRLDAVELAAARRILAGWDAAEVAAHVGRRHPDLLRVPLGRDHTVLMPPEPRR